MHAEPTIPADHREMTVTWMQSVLEFSGHEVEVTGVDLGPIGTGQMAENLRAELTYTDPAADAPTSVVIAELGVESYSAGQCYDNYCAQSFHALLIIVLGSMMTGRTERGDQMFMTMLNRSVRQIDDLDARTWLS